jgi:predicted nucleic acid-binding Zn ribbon protein
MPLYEVHCDACRATDEVFFHHWYSPDPPCPVCLGPRRRLMSCFASPFMGSLRKYSDLKREGAQMDGFWAYKKKSSVSGQPEAVFLDSVSAVREFNKAEGLTAPGEVPRNVQIGSDGKTLSSTGMSGQWAGPYSIPSRLQEMISTPAERCSPPPGTACPSMPADYGVRVEAVQPTAEVGG